MICLVKTPIAFTSFVLLMLQKFLENCLLKKKLNEVEQWNLAGKGGVVDTDLIEINLAINDKL